MSTLVSIIVPCYKQAHFLKESLASVLAQQYSHWECIIVNDGSPDDTSSVAQKWCDQDARFILIEKENGGLSSARNAGIQACKGAFVLPLDADDILHPEYLAKTVPVLEAQQEAPIVSCYSAFFENSISNIIHQHQPNGTTYHAMLYENILVATSLYRKSSWEQVSGYDEQMKTGFEDWEFWLSITKDGREFTVVPEYLFYYRKSKQSMLIDTLKNHRLSTMEYVFKKHKELYIKHYDNTMSYMFFLANMHRNTEIKIKSSTAYKMSRVLSKPIHWIKKITGTASKPMNDL